MLQLLLSRSEKFAVKIQERKAAAYQKNLESKAILDKALGVVESEQKKRTDQIALYKSSLKQKTESLQKREERKRRQHQIAMDAASSSKGNTEQQWRQLLIAQKVFTIFLRRKLSHLMESHKIVEYAFNSIRVNTGLTDTYEIVYKFINREGFFTNLAMKIEKQRAQNEKKTLEIQANKKKTADKLFEVFQVQRKTQELPLASSELAAAKKELAMLIQKQNHGNKNITVVKEWISNQTKKLAKNDMGKLTIEESQMVSGTNLADSLKKLLLGVKEVARVVEKEALKETSKTIFTIKMTKENSAVLSREMKEYGGQSSAFNQSRESFGSGKSKSQDENENIVESEEAQSKSDKDLNEEITADFNKQQAAIRKLLVPQGDLESEHQESTKRSSRKWSSVSPEKKKTQLGDSLPPMKKKEKDENKKKPPVQLSTFPKKKNLVKRQKSQKDSKDS